MTKKPQKPKDFKGQKPRTGTIKETFDPKEQAIKYKAYRHIFSDKDVRKGLDERTIIRKIKKSKSLAGRYQQYVDMLEDGNPSGKVYPWQNPFNKCLFWTAYWTPRFLKWGFFTFLVLFVINYIPGPTQHIIELLAVRSIYDTAPIKRLPDSLETYAHSANIVDQHGTVIKSYGKRRVTQQIPKQVQMAIMACEDHYFLPHPNNPWYANTFLVHPGVSWINLAGAVKDTLMGNTRGASTIVMQNAKKIMGNKERTIAHKIEEIILAYMMVTRFGKERNLNFYINTVPVGANIYGFPAAASNYFKKDLSELNIQQLLAIGSFIPNHNRQIAFYEIIKGKSFSDLSDSKQRHARGALNKVNLALTYLWERGELEEEEYRDWLLTDEESIRRIGFRDFTSPLYGEEEWTSWSVIKEVTRRRYKIEDRTVTGTQLLLDERGDVVIETGVDLQLVEKIKEIISNFLRSKTYQYILERSNQNTWEKDLERYTSRNMPAPYKDFSSFMRYLNRHTNVGVIIINQKGEIISYVGGKEFLQGTADGVDAGDTSSKDKNRVIIDLMNTKAKITPSSTIKPIIAYYAMVVNNAKLHSRYSDKPLEYKYVENMGKQMWLPRNWYEYNTRGKGANRYLGRLYTLSEAQVTSINTIFARLYTNRQLRNTMLLDFNEVGLDYNREDAKYWPFGIGASDVSVRQWLGIYNAFLDGNYRDPSFVRRILVNGKEIYNRQTDAKYEPLSLFDAKREREAEMNVLYDICNRGTASTMRSEFKYHKNLVSGKTGTAPKGKSSLFISHFNPYRDRASNPENNLTMIVSFTTNTGGYKSVGNSGQGPAKVAGRIYSHLFNKELQEMMDEKVEKAKQENSHFRNNHVYWANVNRYMDSLLNKKCGSRPIYENLIGVDAYEEALEQILNSNNRIYTGRDRIFKQLVQYYCDQEKVVKMRSAPTKPSSPSKKPAQ